MKNWNYVMCRTEKEELVNQLSTVQEERDTVLAENVEVKKKVEEVETWIEEERQRNEILQKEMEEKVQFASDVEEERVMISFCDVINRMSYKVQ